MSLNLQTKQKIIDEVEMVIERLNLNINQYDTITLIPDSFINKMELLFKNCSSDTLTFQFKTEDNVSYVRTDIFNKENDWSKTGTAHTYNSILRGLHYFAIMPYSIKYDEVVMQNNGWYIPLANKYDSLKEYLFNEQWSDNIIKCKRLEKIIINAIYLILYKFNIAELLPKSVIHYIKPQTLVQMDIKLSAYKNIFETTFLGLFKKDSIIKSINKKEIDRNPFNIREVVLGVYSKNLKFLSEYKEKYPLINKDQYYLDQLIHDYRDAFKKNFESLYGLKDLSIKDKDFKYPDLAHIKEVSTIKEIFKATGNEKILEEIADPNNGILLDPNTHRLWDQNELYLSYENEQYVFRYSKNNKLYAIIKKTLVNPERTKYINERNNEN